MKNIMNVGLCILFSITTAAIGSVTVTHWHAERLGETRVVVGVSLGGVTGTLCEITVLIDATDRGTNATAWAIKKPAGMTTNTTHSCAIDLGSNTTYSVCRLVLHVDGEETWSDTVSLQSTQKGYSKEQVVAMDLAVRQQEYAQVKASGISPEALMEQYQFLIEEKVPPSTWREWMTNFNGVILDPPVVFDMNIDMPEDRSNTVNMVKWVWHQVWRKDTNALDRVSTPTGRKYIREFGIGEIVTRADGTKVNVQDDMFDSTCTTVKILMGARYEFEDKSLYCILTRRQHSSDPLAHKVDIRTITLLRHCGKLWVTGQDETFHGGPWFQGGFTNSTWMTTFNELEMNRTVSDMPAHFFSP
jgi:hypothetical protein